MKNVNPSDLNTAMQCAIIILKMLILFAIAYVYSQKERGLIKSLVQYLLYGDISGIEWFANNLLYIILLLIGTGQIFAFIGLLHQFSLNQVSTKSSELFAGGFLSSLGFLALIIERYLASKNIKIRVIFSGKKILTPSHK